MLLKKTLLSLMFLFSCNLFSYSNGFTASEIGLIMGLAHGAADVCIETDPTTSRIPTNGMCIAHNFAFLYLIFSRNRYRAVNYFTAMLGAYVAVRVAGKLFFVSSDKKQDLELVYIAH